MNTNLLAIVKQIISEQGEGVLSEPRRVTAFFADLAKDEPKPQRNAFVKCLEHRFVGTLKNVTEPDRTFCKQQLAQKLHYEEGFDLGLCGETLELLSAVLFGEEQGKTCCANCGKELQEEWLRCPYCSTPVAGKSQVISSAISSGSGGWEYGIEQIALETSTPTNYTINKTDSASETKLNELFTPTEKSGYKKMCNFIGTAIWVILGVFLLIQILGGGIDPSISFNTMVCCVVFYIILYFMGKYTLKNKCKKCKYFDGANNCTRMNMNLDEAIQFDCLCR